MDMLSHNPVSDLLTTTSAVPVGGLFPGATSEAVASKYFVLKRKKATAGNWHLLLCRYDHSPVIEYNSRLCMTKECL